MLKPWTEFSMSGSVSAASIVIGRQAPGWSDLVSAVQAWSRENTNIVKRVGMDNATFYEVNLLEAASFQKQSGATTQVPS